MKKEANMDNSVKITSLIVAGILVLALMAGLFLKPVDYTNTVQSSGESSLKITPDLVSINFNIETKGDTSEEANSANSEILEQLIENLEKLGFEREEIQTTNFNIYPNYEWSNGMRKENGYLASHSLVVRISTESSAKMTAIIDAGAKAGTSISYINFELSPGLESQVKAEALKLASQDAKLKAEAIAQGLDKDIGKLVSISNSEFNYYPYRVYSASGVAYEEEMALAKDSVENLQPSEQNIYARVTATYKLK